MHQSSAAVPAQQIGPVVSSRFRRSADSSASSASKLQVCRDACRIVSHSSHSLLSISVLPATQQPPADIVTLFSCASRSSIFSEVTSRIRIVKINIAKLGCCGTTTSGQSKFRTSACSHVQESFHIQIRAACLSYFQLNLKSLLFSSFKVKLSGSSKPSDIRSIRSYWSVPPPKRLD